MEPSLAASLAQTMDPPMEHCWDQSLAASLVPQTASMMATTTEPDLAQTRDQSWAATTAPSWELNLELLKVKRLGKYHRLKGKHYSPIVCL